MTEKDVIQEIRESPDGDSGNEIIQDSLPKRRQSKIPIRKSLQPKNDLIIEAPEEFRTSLLPPTPPPEAGDTIDELRSKVNYAPSHINDISLVTAKPTCQSNLNDISMNSAPPPLCAAAPSDSEKAVASIAKDAHASGCSSRVTAVTVSAVSPNQPPINKENETEGDSVEESDDAALSWHFAANGRLVFKPVNESDDLVSSRLINPKLDDKHSRLKHIEAKLKEAGITGWDDNQPNDEEIIPDEYGNDLCEFQVDSFSYFESSDDSSTSSSSSSIILIPTNNNNKMGIESERIKHNPDRNNLKSLLKRTNTKTKRSNSNRVVFNENKNEFFDADYIILIREECDYDDDDDEGVCTCNQHEMVRLTCCEPNCNCGLDEEFSEQQPTPQSPKFAPPLEFVDAVTLSPPEGYKDMMEQQQLFALQQMAQRATVCRECSITHDDVDGEKTSPMENCTIPDKDEEEIHKTDQSQQTTPTTPSSDSGPQHCIANIFTDSDDDDTKPDSPINGILKGGRLWKQQSFDNDFKPEPQIVNNEPNVASDDEGNSRRSVRFTENEQSRDSCDGASDNTENDEKVEVKEPNKDTSEMTFTFKLGNHVLISNNSLKPNSAVRQLFPCTTSKPHTTDAKESEQYLVTTESLKAFEDAKRSKLPRTVNDDQLIKQTIERNTLRRSLIRYEPRLKKLQKTDNSLVERIKQLTCNVDEQIPPIDEEKRVSPPGEESKLEAEHKDHSFSPSSSSTNSSNSSMSSTYRKITDLFGKREKIIPEQNELPDLAINEQDESKRFLTSTLTACVSNVGSTDEYYYQIGDRTSMASSVGTEYSLEDIDNALTPTEDESAKKIAPDVLAGTPANESSDELADFAHQGAGRIERLKKKYQSKEEEDDEHDDYGFNRRPSVRGIKPKFGSTTEILQQIQNQLQTVPLPGQTAWPYYSETDPKTRNINYQGQPPGQYRPTTLQDENLDCNQRCVRQVYRINGNQTYTTKIDYYQSLPRKGRPLSPPPLEVSKNYHQTMVYIPYNHIEPAGYYQDYVRVTNQNQINKRFIEPIYAKQVRPQGHYEEHHYQMVMHQKPMVRMPRSESPISQYARSTQTPLPPSSTCTNYYPTYRQIPVWPTEYANSKHRQNYERFESSGDSSTSSGYSQKNGIKPRYLEREAPEGAAAGSTTVHDTSTSSTMTSPTSPPLLKVDANSSKPMFYAMNV